MGRHRLTNKKVESNLAPDRYADGGNLYLIVDQSGNKRWSFIFRWQGRQPEMGLGSFPVVTLAEARGRALDAERLLRLQINPIEHRKGQRAYKEGIPTFGELADQVVTAKAAGFQNAKHIRQWWQTLGDAYCKTIRSKPVDEVTIDDVLGVLKPQQDYEAVSRKCSTLQYPRATDKIIPPAGMHSNRFYPSRRSCVEVTNAHCGGRNFQTSGSNCQNTKKMLRNCSS